VFKGLCGRFGHHPARGAHLARSSAADRCHP
jgi:hypothetical protein